MVITPLLVHTITGFRHVTVSSRDQLNKLFANYSSGTLTAKSSGMRRRATVTERQPSLLRNNRHREANTPHIHVSPSSGNASVGLIPRTPLSYLATERLIPAHTPATLPVAIQCRLAASPWSPRTCHFSLMAEPPPITQHEDRIFVGPMQPFSTPCLAEIKGRYQWAYKVGKYLKPKQWRSYLGWHPVRKLVVSPHRNMGRGIPHDSVRLFCGNLRTIHRAELLRDRVGVTPKKVKPGAARLRRSPCYATEPKYTEVIKAISTCKGLLWMSHTPGGETPEQQKEMGEPTDISNQSRQAKRRRIIPGKRVVLSAGVEKA
ncbi:hypothetical protein J6590_052879 [Homalodisca vitripennis]|nr:hypothetical protein J6590_052879 [Homalodisca vitripennis]